ncbi:hypothetical protein [Lederbergia citri]|uniref:DUF4025 domain-containing protein n=1 Tax=Lederbergia citri TaxID=2833580 RepID=A0A942TEJ6_9BACI|nr:hypothetical protein [Lederbergia citri]MBS4194994.1 hypothetical protein [Lederbergia citri]
MKKKDVQQQYQYNEENNEETIEQIRDVYRSGAIDQNDINDEILEERINE